MAERQNPSKSALALMKLEREELEERAAASGVSTADRTFTSSDGLRFILLDSELQAAEQQRDRLLAAVSEVAALGKGWREEGNPYMLIPGKTCKRISEVADEVENEGEERG